MQVIARLNEYRQSPRKVRLVGDLVKGKRASEAVTALSFLVKEASLPIRKLIGSGIKNAKNTYGVEEKDLFIKDLRVDEGVTLKRSMPRARGSAFPIRKRTSHITLILESKEN